MAVTRADKEAELQQLETAFKSGILSFAMSSTCLTVTVPTFVLFGSADPFAMFAARFSRMAAGGVFVMKV